MDIGQNAINIFCERMNNGFGPKYAMSVMMMMMMMMMMMRVMIMMMMVMMIMIMMLGMIPDPLIEMPK